MLVSSSEKLIFSFVLVTQGSPRGPVFLPGYCCTSYQDSLYNWTKITTKSVLLLKLSWCPVENLVAKFVVKHRTCSPSAYVG